MFALTRRIVIVLISGAFLGVPATQGVETDQAVETAKRFVQFLSRGECLQAHKMLNELMHEGLRPVDLDLSWYTQAFQYGKFRSFGEPATQVKPDVIVVDVPVRWDRGERTLSVLVGPAGSVDGFAWGAVEADKKPTPEQPNSKIKQVKVKIGEGMLALPGILTLPAEGGPRAAVLLVPDGGQNDADLTYGMLRPFKDLAEGLAEQGIATLRYEQRTLRHASYVDRSKLTVREEIMDDAVLAWKALRSREELKNTPLYLLGFARSATLLAEIATPLDGVSGLILMAGWARPTEEALSTQMDYLATLARTQERQDEFKVVMEKLDRLRKRLLDPNEELFTLPVSYWYDLMDRDAEVAVQRTAAFPRRILVLQGKRDFETSVEDYELWMRGLNAHPDATGKLFERLNHVFAAGEGDSLPDEYDVPKYVDPEVIDLMAHWLLASKGK